MLKMITLLLTCPLLSWNQLQSILALAFPFILLNLYYEFPNHNINYVYQTDFISSTLILLSLWITMLSLWSSTDILVKNIFKKEFTLTIILSLMILILVFSLTDLLSFYISFELSLIPLFMLITGWGKTPERSEASMYMLFYTLSASLPFMGAIFWMYMNQNSLFMFPPNMFNYTNTLLYFSMLFAFMVKLPLFFLHLWLPKAHVEAPLAGSMILAGILLKLGGYGIIRILPVLLKLNKIMSWMWISLALMGSISTCLICLRSTDLKMLIAYSSVVHMGFMLVGLMTTNKTGLLGSLFMMLAHGLSSSSLFCIADITYNRTHTRSMLFNKGLLLVLPNLTTWWFLLSTSSMGAPPSLTLLSEIFLIMSLISWKMKIMMMLFILLMMECSYTIFVFYSTQHGKPTLFMGLTHPAHTKEYMSMILHWAPLNIIVLNSTLLT